MNSDATPETDEALCRYAHPAWPAGRRFTVNEKPVVLADFARKLERERNHWRDEHDRVVREYQHRLMVIGTAVIEATSYPEDANSPDAGAKESQ